jgi:DNA damage-inducible protein 1
MEVVVVADDGRRVPLTVDPLLEAELLAALIEVELSVPIARQSLFVGTKRLNFSQSLVEQGVPPGAIIRLKILGPAGNAAPVEDQIMQLMRGAAAPRVSAPPVAAQLSAEEQIRALMSGGPAPAAAPPRKSPVPPPQRLPAAGPETADFIRRLMAGGSAQTLPVDPMDPEYQRRLLQQIEEQNLRENLEHAMEHTPEAFGRVTMLYVPAEVNRVPLNACVDSGAQMTIMNESTAERCGLLRLLDRRFAGVAAGVGNAKILGRIHMAVVRLGSLFLPMSITVLESKSMEFLIGLDQLRRHQMSIDLKDNALKIQDTSLPFLAEGELPLHLRGEVAEVDSNLDGTNASAKKSFPPEVLQRLCELKRHGRAKGLLSGICIILLRSAVRGISRVHSAVISSTCRFRSADFFLTKSNLL